MLGISKQSPKQFHAGDTVQWLSYSKNHMPADGFVLSVDYTNGSAHYNITSTDNGDGWHLITVPAAFSALIPAGDYTLSIAAILGTTRQTIETSSIVIKPNLSAVADNRTHVKKVLDALEAWIETRNMGMAEYQIAGRALKEWSNPDLILFYDRYRRLYQQEQAVDRINSGKRPRRRLLTRMYG